MGDTVVITPPPATTVVVAGATGPQGPPGPAGPPGTRFTQTISSPVSSITVAHNLGVYPNVSFVDAGGAACIPDATHLDVNHVYLVFAAPTTGTVVCS